MEEWRCQANGGHHHHKCLAKTVAITITITITVTVTSTKVANLCVGSSAKSLTRSGWKNPREHQQLVNFNLKPKCVFVCRAATQPEYIRLFLHPGTTGKLFSRPQW